MYASATDLHHQVDVVEQAIKGSPMTFDKDIQESKDEEVRIQSYLRESTIPIDTDTPPSLDDLLKRFWETEEISKCSPCYTPEEKQVLKHYETNHTFLSTVGRYQVKLPKKSGEPELGESRQQAVKRFFSNERYLKIKGTLQNFNDVVKEYIDLGHAEPVPLNEAISGNSTFYMPMHGVHNESSSTTKLRVVFDASAKSSSGVSLNDILMVGPTIYPCITDVLLRFRTYKVAISADISKMYRAVELDPSDRDLHRFVWRPDQNSQLTDYRMTRITFSVSAYAYATVFTANCS